MVEDRELAAAAARGDQGAFAALVDRHRSAIYGLAYKITLHEEDALDVTQEVFLRLAERIGSYSGRGSFRSFVMTITAREAANVLRRRGRREIPTEPEELERIADGTGGSGQQLEGIEHGQRMKLVASAMHMLTPQQRAVLSLRLQQSMELRAIGEQLGIPYGQVRAQLSNAVSKLRSILTKEKNGV